MYILKIAGSFSLSLSLSLSLSCTHARTHAHERARAHTHTHTYTCMHECIVRGRTLVDSPAPSLSESLPAGRLHVVTCDRLSRASENERERERERQKERERERVWAVPPAGGGGPAKGH
jgi:hypothetical protein